MNVIDPRVVHHLLGGVPEDEHVVKAVKTTRPSNGASLATGVKRMGDDIVFNKC